MSHQQSDLVKESAHGCGRGALSVLAPLFLSLLFVGLAVLAFLYLRRGIGPAHDFTPPDLGAAPALGGGGPLLLGVLLVVLLLLVFGILLLVVLLCCCKCKQPGLGPLALLACPLLDALRATATALEVSGAAVESVREALGVVGRELRNVKREFDEQRVSVPSPSFPQVKPLLDYVADAGEFVFNVTNLPEPRVVNGDFGTTNVQITGIATVTAAFGRAAGALEEVSKQADELNQFADHMKERQEDAAHALRRIAKMLEPFCPDAPVKPKASD